MHSALLIIEEPPDSEIDLSYEWSHFLDQLAKDLDSIEPLTMLNSATLLIPLHDGTHTLKHALNAVGTNYQHRVLFLSEEPSWVITPPIEKPPC